MRVQLTKTREESTTMFENINIRSSVPVYVQIENYIQFAISADEIKPGDRVPTIAALSKQLDINPNTVAKAYRDLEVMGLLYSRRGMGVFVNKGARDLCREKCRTKIISRIHEVVTEAGAAGMTPKEIRKVCNTCFSSGCAPYAPTPKEALALAKNKSGK